MKTALFVDGANIHAASKQLGYDIDYSKVIAVFNENSFLVRAFYYTATLTEADGTNNLRKILDYLEYNSWTVVTKESKTFADRLTGLTKVKGNMDIEIAVDCMQLADKVDSIVLFSGDGDFTSLVKAVQNKGCHVTVVSTLNMVADELRRQADRYVDMNQPRIKALIARAHAKT